MQRQGKRRERIPSGEPSVPPVYGRKSKGTQHCRGDPQEDFINRGYKGKTTEVDNECDLDMLLDNPQTDGR